MSNTNSAVATVPQAALQQWSPKTIEILSGFPVTEYNLLVPTMSIRQVNPFLVPDIETVRLNPDPAAGEIYHSEDMKQGYYAPTKVGLRRLRDVAGITQIRSQRIDNGADPAYVEWQVELEMVQPSGRPIRAIGSKAVDLRPHATKNWTPARLGKAREHMAANAESKAANRALRDLLSLQHSYPQAQLAKPFAILRWIPDWTQPEVRAQYLATAGPTTAQVFGPDIKQVGPGVEIAKTRQPDDDAPIEGQYTDSTASAAGSPDVRDGASAAAEDPFAATPAAGSLKTDTERATRIVAVIRERANASGLTGAIKDPQKDPIRAIFGANNDLLRATTQMLWQVKPGDMTAAQAQALINADNDDLIDDLRLAVALA